MPKRKDPSSFAAEIAWVAKLPDGGGQWGKELISTVASIESELSKLRAQKEQIDATVEKRSKFLRECAKRASKEALMLYSESVVQKAKDSSQPTASPN